MNLRVHNKAWLEQVQGVSAMAQRLDGHYGCDVLIYLDGYRDCDETVNEIRKAVADLGVEIVDGTLATFPETLLWAYACRHIRRRGRQRSGSADLARGQRRYRVFRHRASRSVGMVGQGQDWQSPILLAPTPEDISNVTTEPYSDYYSDYSISPLTLLDLLDSLMSRRMELH